MFVWLSLNARARLSDFNKNKKWKSRIYIPTKSFSIMPTVTYDLSNLSVIEEAHGKGSFSTKLVPKVAILKGDIIGSFKETASETDTIRYSFALTVQVGKSKHIELNSKLLYINHSCDPNVRMDTVQFEAVALRNIAVDEELTFFYPSTEWEMAQPFDCWCGSNKCLKSIKGAKYFTEANVASYKDLLEPHILSLLQEKQLK